MLELRWVAHEGDLTFKQVSDIVPRGRCGVGSEMMKVTSFVILTAAWAVSVCAAQAPATSNGADPPHESASAASAAPRASSATPKTKSATVQVTSATVQVTSAPLQIITSGKPQIAFTPPRAAPVTPQTASVAPRTASAQVTILGRRMVNGQEVFCRLQTTGSRVEKTVVCLTKAQLQKEEERTRQYVEMIEGSGGLGIRSEPGQGPMKQE